MRILPRHPYTWAVVALGLLVVLAWTTRGRFVAVGPGVPAPDFTATTLTGETVSLESYAGNVILLNIWATWCPPCREEMPSMERLYRHFKARGDGFEVVAVSIDALPGATDETGNVGGDLHAFVAEFGLTFPVLHDPEGRIQRIYQTTGVPESFIIGRDGLIYRRLAGATNWDAQQHYELIERLLAAP